METRWWSANNEAATRDQMSRRQASSSRSRSSARRRGATAGDTEIQSATPQQARELSSAAEYVQQRLLAMRRTESVEKVKAPGSNDLYAGSIGDWLSSSSASDEHALPQLRTLGGDPTLSLLLPLLILLSTLLFLLVFFLVFLIVLRRRRGRGIALLDQDGPLDLSREEDFEAEGGVAGVEERWLEQQDETVRRGYERAKVWQTQYVPNSMATDITLSQFLSIQEKGVSAWSFEPDYESNSGVFVTSRTEITFLEDGIGMAPEDGGACGVQSNLPLPRLNEVYYWECKFFEKPESTNVAIGLATKPYPSFRMPGWSRYSIGYHSADGFKSHNYPFTAQSYGPPLSEGDVLGVGYRPRTGAVFFTRNGKKLEDAYVGLTKHNLFPTVAADGAASIHVNLGQSGFVFIEANVKKWGLAPMIGTLAPPPAYGSNMGSILLETAVAGSSQPPQNAYSDAHSHHYSTSANSALTPAPPPPRHQRQPSNEALAVAALQQPQTPPDSHSSRSSRHRRGISNSTAPIRPSPLRTSMTRQRTSSYTSSTASSPRDIPGSASISPEEDGDDGHGGSGDEPHLPHNPPTPGQLDISLRAMSPFSRRIELESGVDAPPAPSSSTPPYHASTAAQGVRTAGDISPPSYQLIDSNQYPAGVAEAMLEAMPEDQFNALFSQAAISNRHGRESRQTAAVPMGAPSSADHFGGPSSSSNSSFILHRYENRSSNVGDEENLYQGEQQQNGVGLGLRGFLGSLFGNGTNSQTNSE